MKNEVIIDECGTTSVDQVLQSGSLKNHRIVIVKSVDDFEKIKEDWLNIISNFGKASPFINYELFKQYCSSFSDGIEPYIAAFYDDVEPVALLIGGQTNKPVLSLKAVGLKMFPMRCWTIYLDGIITNGTASSIDAVIDYCANQLGKSEIDIIKLQALHLDDKAVVKLVQGLQDKFKAIRKPYIHLYRKAVDANIGLDTSINSSKTKSTFRRKDRKLTKHFGGTVNMLLRTSMVEVNPFIEDASSITSQTYQAALGTGVSKNDYWQTIVQALASSGSFRGYLLKPKDVPIAYVLGAVVKDRFTLFATGYLPKYKNISPGTVLMNRVLSSLNNEGVCLVDFGYGDASYKRLHANHIEEDLFLQLYGKRFRTSIAWILESCGTIAIRIVIHMLRKIGLYKRVKRIWRQHLLERSIRSINSK